jgi:hypothetical protein
VGGASNEGLPLVSIPLKQHQIAERKQMVNISPVFEPALTLNLDPLVVEFVRNPKHTPVRRIDQDKMFAASDKNTVARRQSDSR